MTTARPWLDRFAGAAIGVAATAWWFARGDAPTDGAVEAIAAVSPADEDPPHTTSPRAAQIDGTAGTSDAPARDLVSFRTVGPATDLAATPGSEAAPASPDERSIARDEDRPPAPRVVDDPAADLAGDAEDDAGTATVAAVGPDGTAPPTLPLPRMPGDTRLSTTARFDEASDSWVLKAAYRVHARDHHVVAFYRKALLDQGLSVSRSEDPPSEDGAVKTYLRGKSSRIHAQVGILPRTDALETRVWILWRTRA